MCYCLCEGINGVYRFIMYGLLVKRLNPHNNTRTKYPQKNTHTRRTWFTLLLESNRWYERAIKSVVYYQHSIGVVDCDVSVSKGIRTQSALYRFIGEL